MPNKPVNKPGLEQCFQPGYINKLQLKNRFIKAGTFENKSPDGIPGQALLDFHRQFASGGLAMTTLGYCAVENNGRISSNMMTITEEIRPQLTSIIDALHESGIKVSGQMAHCGGFSKNTALSIKYPKGPSRGINLIGFPQGMLFTEAMQADDMRIFIQAYYDAASRMKSMGFDALEIHFGHGYGLCQFISPKTNKRKDNYGGSLANRMRLPLAVLAAVREAVGADFPILAKISLTEGIKGGIRFSDSLEICKMLDQAGIDGIICSGGSSTMNPMWIFRGDNIQPHLIASEPKFMMRCLYRLVGPSMFRSYPFHELYFLEQAAQIRAAVQCKMIYIGGANSNDAYARLMQAGFDFIQLGRGLLAQPDLVHQAQTDSHFKSNCIHCNRCVATIESPQGIHCPIFTLDLKADDLQD